MAKDEGLPAKGEKTHLYAQGGVYTVTVADEDNAARNKKFTIVVPFGPIMTVIEDVNDNTRRAVLVTVNNAGEGSVTLNWGDNTPTSTNAGDNVDQTRHRYLQAGKYTITATDADDPNRKASFEVTVPFQTVMPTMTATEDTGVPSGLGVSVLVDNHDKGDVTVDWGDDTTPATNPGDNTTASTHTYAAAGAYTIVVTDADDPHGTVEQELTVPFGTAPTIVLSEEVADPRRQVRVTLTNARAGRTYEVLWAAGGTPEDLVGTSTPPYSLLHTYPADGANTVTVRDKVDTTLAVTEDVTVPFTGPPFTVAQNGSEARGVSATIDAPVADVIYEVNWGDAETWDAFANPPVALTHTYGGTTAQTFKVSVRDQAVPATVTTRQVTVPFAVFAEPEPAALASSSRKRGR